MNILLINPWIYDFAAYDLWARPIALLKLSTYLKKQNHNIFYLDCLDRFIENYNVLHTKYECGKYKKEKIEKPEILKHIERDYFRYGLSYNLVIEKLKNFPEPDIIFLNSMMTYWYLGVSDMVKVCRNIFPKTKIILGGIYASIMPKHAKKNCAVDYIYNSDCKKFLKEIKIFNKETDDFISEGQDRSLVSNKNVHVLQTSYGCLFNCSYCASKIIFPNFIQKEIEDVVDEIEYSYKDGAKEFVFYDDSLLINSDKHIKPILKNIIDKKIKINFHTPNGLHARYLDKELAELMYKSGFKTIRLSLETSDQVLQEKKGNKVNRKDFETAINNLKLAGFKGKDICVYLMAGLLDQTQEQLYKDICYVSNQKVKIMLGNYSPVYGTKDYNLLVEKGIINKHEDPLLLNNTIFIYKMKYDLDFMKKIKERILRSNNECCLV